MNTEEDDAWPRSDWDDGYARGYLDGCNMGDWRVHVVAAREQAKLRRWQLRLRWRRTSDRREPDAARFDDDRLFMRERYALFVSGRVCPAVFGLRRERRPIHGPKGVLP